MSEKINNKRVRIFNIVDKYESDLPELIYADIINDLVNAKNNKDLDEIDNAIKYWIPDNNNNQLQEYMEIQDSNWHNKNKYKQPYNKFPEITNQYGTNINGKNKFKKTKRKYKKKAGTKKNIFNLLKNRELKGKIIDKDKDIHPIINDKIKEEIEKMKIEDLTNQINKTKKIIDRAQIAGDNNEVINNLKNNLLNLEKEILPLKIKQTYKKLDRARIDGDEDKRINLSKNLETLIGELEKILHNNEVLMILGEIQEELQEEKSYEHNDSNDDDDDDDDFNDSDEGHHSGRSSPSSASSKKRKKRKKRKKTKGKGKSLVNKYYMNTLINPPNISSLHKSGIQLIEDISYAPGVTPRVESKKFIKKTKPKGSVKNTRIKRKH